MDGTETPPVRLFFGLKGHGHEEDGPPNDGSVRAVLRTALEDSSAALCLYVIVVAGRSVRSPEARTILGSADLWIWFGMLVVCNIFLQIFYPTLRQHLVQATIFAVLLVLMSPIKRRDLVGANA